MEYPTIGYPGLLLGPLGTGRLPNELAELAELKEDALLPFDALEDEALRAADPPHGPPKPLLLKPELKDDALPPPAEEEMAALDELELAPPKPPYPPEDALDELDELDPAFPELPLPPLFPPPPPPPAILIDTDTATALPP